jgi:thiol-disulfide isomerase/thioredoxin
MRLFILLLLLSNVFQVQAQQLNLDSILNQHIIVYNTDGNYDTIQLNSIKKDYLLVDFWASWCKPCIEALPELDRINKTYAEKLAVVTVSGDKKARFTRFIKGNDFKFIKALDEKNKLFDKLGIKIIPTTLFLNINKKEILVFEGRKLTQTDLDTLLSGKSIVGAKKELSFISEPEQVLKSFKSNKAVKNSLLETPPYLNSSTFSFKWNRDGFNNRRITFVNFSIPGLYRYALNKTYVRYKTTLNSEIEVDKSKLICLDVIVDKDNSNYSKIKAKVVDYLSKTYPQFKPKFKKIISDSCYYLVKIGSVNSLKPSSKFTKIAQQGPHFNATNIPLYEFANFLEEQTRVPVIDKTGLLKRYDITCNFNYENLNTISNELRKLGLRLEKRTNELIEYLFIN